MSEPVPLDRGRSRRNRRPNFGPWVDLVDGIGAKDHCASHPEYSAGCERCQVANRVNKWPKRHALREESLLTAASRPTATAHTTTHTTTGVCRCGGCFRRMAQIGRRGMVSA